MKKLPVFALLFNAVLLSGSFWQDIAAQAAPPVDIITTIAGGGARDGGLATDALTNSPRKVVFDSAGNLYFADARNSRVRKVDAVSGIITTVAGTGEAGFSGDGGPATLARLNRPVDIAFDSAGALYIVGRGPLVIAPEATVAFYRRVFFSSPERIRIFGGSMLVLVAVPLIATARWTPADEHGATVLIEILGWLAAAAVVWCTAAPASLQRMANAFWDAVSEPTLRRAIGVLNVAFGLFLGWVAFFVL